MSGEAQMRAMGMQELIHIRTLVSAHAISAVDTRHGWIAAWDIGVSGAFRSHSVLPICTKLLGPSGLPGLFKTLRDSMCLDFQRFRVAK